MFLGQKMAAAQGRGATAQPLSLMLPGMVMYGILAVALVWLGIGSISARRWARALILLFSWGWLITGIITGASMAFVLPGMTVPIAGAPGRPAPAVPHQAMIVAMIVAMAFMSIIFIALPIVWVLFYSGRNVKATCVARNPAPSWTDACPLPVLALCLLAIFSVPMGLLMPFTGHMALPFFGSILTGAPAGLLSVVVAVLFAYAAWAMYRLNVRGWWVQLALFCFYTASSWVTFSRHSFIELFQRMKYPQATVDQLQANPFFQGNQMSRFMLLFFIPVLLYLLFIKKYFRRAS